MYAPGIPRSSTPTAAQSGGSAAPAAPGGIPWSFRPPQCIVVSSRFTQR